MTGRWMIVSAVVASLVMATTMGCVPKDQYDKALAAARRANDALKESQADREALQEDNRNLRADLARRQQELDGKARLVDSLEREKALLADRFAKLKALYDKLAAGEGVPALPDFRALPPQVDQALRALADRNADLMEYLPKYGMIKLKADLTFAKGKTDLKPEAVAAMKKLAEVVNSDAAKAFHVYIAGHTDNIPLVKPETRQRHGTNWGLSVHRAVAVVRVLFEAGVEQRRMAAVGFSKYHPVVPNLPSNKGHPLNRRVEIWIVPPDRLLTASTVVETEGTEAVVPQK
jgi:chemotaxis protein MotB